MTEFAQPHSAPEGVGKDSGVGRIVTGAGHRRIYRQPRQARWLCWSVSGSLVLHVLLFYVLTLPVMQITALAVAPNLDFFWMSPFFPSGDDNVVKPESDVSSPEPAAVPIAAALAPDKPELPVDPVVAKLPEMPDNPSPPADSPPEPTEAELVVVKPPAVIKQPPVAIAVNQPSVPAPKSIKPTQPDQATPVSKPEKPSTVLPSRIKPPVAPETPAAVAWSQPSAREEPAKKNDTDNEQQQIERIRQERLASEQAEQAMRSLNLQKQLAMEKAEKERAARQEADRERAELESRNQELQRREAAERALRAERAEKAERAERAILARKKAEEERIAAEKSRLNQLERERAEQERKIMERQRLAEQRRLESEKAERERQAAEMARQDILAREKAEQERSAALQREHQKVAVIRQQAATAKPESKIPEKSAQANQARENNDSQPPRKTEKPKSLAIPSVNGDLKLVASGSASHNVRIRFREFGLKRRNRPFTKAESKSDTKIVPVVVATQENTREYVVAKARDGVYTMSLELGDGAGDVRFTLLLYDGSAKKLRKPLGNLAARQKVLQVKILMPEGILWDDDSAYTGSMEDSDSVTKFNADSGLVWKEFNDDVMR